MESASSQSAVTDSESDETSSDEAAPEPLDAALTTGSLPPFNSAGKPSRPATPTPTETQTWRGSRVTMNTTAARDSGYNSSSASGTSYKGTSCNDRVGVRTFDNGEPQQDGKYDHHEECLRDPNQASSSHRSPLISPRGQQERQGANAAKGRDNFHYSGTFFTPDPDGERFRRQLYEGGVSSLAQEYLGSNNSPSPRHPPPPSPPPPVEQIRMGGYSELAQEYLNPSASRRRRQQAKGNNHSALANDSHSRRRSHYTNHWQPQYASSFQPSARLPKLPPKGFVEELPDSDSD